MSTKQIKIGTKRARRIDDRGALIEYDEFRVISAKNSTTYLPGSCLDKAQVDALCDGSSWDVTLVPLNEGGGR